VRPAHHDLLASDQAHTQVRETPVRADAPPCAASRWIESPAWDFVRVLNALWLAPLVLLQARGHAEVHASLVDGLDRSPSRTAG
jgi:hypothetical protein